MHNAMWGIDRVEEGEKAEAAAILEAVVSRWVVNKDDGGLMTRWLVDDEVCFLALLLTLMFPS